MKHLNGEEMKRWLIFLIFSFLSLNVSAEDTDDAVFIYYSGSLVDCYKADEVEDLSHIASSDEMSEPDILRILANGEEYDYMLSDVDSVVYMPPSPSKFFWIQTESVVSRSYLTATLRSTARGNWDKWGNTERGFIITSKRLPPKDEQPITINCGTIPQSGNIEQVVSHREHGLIGNKTYYYKAYARYGKTVYGLIVPFHLEPVTIWTSKNPTVEIDENHYGFYKTKVSAHIFGDTDEIFEDPKAKVGFYYDTVNDPNTVIDPDRESKTAKRKEGYITEVGDIEAVLENLKPGTKYYYRPFVEIAGTIYYGISAWFNTGEGKQEKIEVQTLEPTVSDNKYVNFTGKFVGVDLSSDEGTVGFQVDTNPEFLEGSRATFTLGKISDFSSGTFSDVYHGFHQGIIYYYRAFMTIGEDIYYGLTQSFMLTVDVSDRIRTESVRMDEELMFNTVYLSFSVADVNDFNNRTAIGFFYNKTGNPNASNASYIEFNDDTWYMRNSLEGTGTLKLNDEMEGNTRYYVRSYLIINGELLYGNEISFVTFPHIGPTRGQVVDLGLSVKWAGWNIGASGPEEIGDYYAWGETETKSLYSILNYEFYKGWPSPLLKKLDGGITEISGTKYDVARMKWGGSWRMPTKAEIMELATRCTVVDLYEFKKQLGYLFIGPNGNSIFLPNSGLILDDRNIDLDINYRSGTLCEEVDEEDKLWGWGKVYVLSGNPGTDADSPVKVTATSSWSDGDAVRAVCP